MAGVVSAGVWFGLPRAGQPAPDASPSPVKPSASSTSPWGPLAVIPAQDGADQARTEGTLRITETCVFLESRGEAELLFWPADRTTWNEASRAITFENFDGSVVTLDDGDPVVLVGGGDSEAESGMSGEDWVNGMEWVAPPESSCALDPRWAVGAVELAPASEPNASSIATVAEAGGLKLVATFDRMEVEAGGKVTVGLSIENTRPTDVVFEEPCDIETMTVELRAPVEPVGREWDRIADAFKMHALEQSTGSPMESSIRGPLRTTAEMLPCHAASGGDVAGRPTRIIEAGTRYETVLTWTAEIVSGVPAVPGPAPFSIKVLYDPETGAGGLRSAEILESTGTITVVDGAPGAVSAGMALDAALGDPQFAAWLAKQPEDSWVNANLFLQPRAFAAGLPVVPYWDVELYREPRNWAVLLIDAANGEVLRRDFCDIPCDR